MMASDRRYPYPLAVTSFLAGLARLCTVIHISSVYCHDGKDGAITSIALCPPYHGILEAMAFLCIAYFLINDGMRHHSEDLDEPNKIFITISEYAMLTIYATVDIGLIIQGFIILRSWPLTKDEEFYLLIIAALETIHMTAMIMALINSCHKDLVNIYNKKKTTTDQQIDSETFDKKDERNHDSQNSKPIITDATKSSISGLS